MSRRHIFKHLLCIFDPLPGIFLRLLLIQRVVILTAFPLASTKLLLKRDIQRLGF